jgi:hypothetical protein
MAEVRYQLQQPRQSFVCVYLFFDVRRLEEIAGASQQHDNLLQIGEGLLAHRRDALALRNDNTKRDQGELQH